jgi:site-specific DNA recombinase
MKRTAIYLRTNHARSCAIYVRTAVESSESVDTQLAACKQYAERKGFHVAREYVDRVRSGADMKRHALQRMLAEADAGAFHLVLVQRLDRLSRTPTDVHTINARLQRQGIDLLVLEDLIEDLNAGGER